MSVFSHADALKPKRSFFKGLSHSKTFTCDMGQIIPTLFLECYPGDTFKLGSEVVVRFMPMVAPILHEVNVIENYFFVPYRLLSDSNFDWDTFITGGKDGDGKLNGVEQVLPRWDVSSDKYGVGSLWDYFCFPLTKPVASCLPYDFPRRAYNLIYNQYFRDENLMSEVALSNEDILYRCWKKDYFTSALVAQQRGQAPALPGDIMYLGEDGSYHSAFMSKVMVGYPVHAGSFAGLEGSDSVGAYTGDLVSFGTAVTGQKDTSVTPNSQYAPASDISKLVYTGADVADLRLSFQIQKWMERNNRGGYRYTEVIRSHFGTAPADERMQRAEYIGGVIAPIIVSEVLQTGSTDSTSPQGNMAGHGISANSQYIGKYRVKEHGCIIGVMSIMPKPMYMSQGVERQFLRRSRFDFYWPEFANLSEQAIENVELYAQGTNDDFGIFGFQGRFNELRWQGDKVCGLMRLDQNNGGFAFWHLGRLFANAPQLNGAFMRADQIRKDFLAVPSQPACVVSYGNVVHAVRPIPKMPVPGLIDHH